MGKQNPVVVAGQPADFPSTDVTPIPLAAGGGSVVVSGIIATGIPSNPVPIIGAERASDAFDRIRVSNPVTIFDSILSFGASTVYWQQVLTGGGSVTNLPNSSAAQLTVGTAAGDSVVRQSKMYCRYQPGKSQLIVMTGRLGAGVANVRRRIGYFDAQNGPFFQLSGTTLSAVLRSFTSGSAVDTVVTQANWNLDTMDGNGSSAVTIDVSKEQIFLIDLQWLGSGRVRMGFNIDGHIIYCHQFLNANILTTPYMTTANLPVRYEIENLDVTADSHDLIQTCVAVISEGGVAGTIGFPHTASNGTTATSVSTRRAVLSIRPKTTFNGVVNRGHIVLTALEMLVASGTVYWELVYNPTLTGASFTSVGTTSLVEFDTAATTLTGGTVLLSGMLSGGVPITRAGTGIIDLGLIDRVPFTLDITGAVPDILTLVGTAFSGTVLVSAALNWEERR